MKVSSTEVSDSTVYNIDMKDVLIIANGKVVEERGEEVCDCTVFKYSYNSLDVSDITPWNLLFNKRVKDALKSLKAR